MPEVTPRAIAISFGHVLFVAGVIWLCFHLAGTYQATAEGGIRVSTWALFVVVVCSVGLAWLSIRLWLAYMDIFVPHRIQVRLALVGVGASLVAKYLPGKVWGVVAKTYLYKSERLEARQVFAASLLEIYGSVAFAVVVGSVFYIAAVLKPDFLGGVFAIGLAVVVGAVMFLLPMILHRFDFDRYFHVGVPSAQWKCSSIAALVGWNWAYWACFAVIMAVLWQGGVDTAPMKILGVVGAYLISVTAGFLVVVIPGGVGVREGVFVLLAQHLIDRHVALQLAATMRLWACVYDLAFGAISYLVYLRLRGRK